MSPKNAVSLGAFSGGTFNIKAFAEGGGTPHRAPDALGGANRKSKQRSPQVDNNILSTLILASYLYFSFELPASLSP